MNTNWDRKIRFSVTNCLIGIYILVYLCQFLYGVNDSIVRFGMNGAMVLERGEYFRLLTSGFMHGSILHLLMNVQFIYIIGNIVENILGTGRYIFLVIVATLFASLAVLIVDIVNYPGSLTIGASGFGYGLVGALLGFSIMYPQRYYRSLVSSLMQNILLSSLVFLLAGASISWAGHFGGFLGGLIAVAILNTFFRKPQW